MLLSIYDYFRLSESLRGGKIESDQSSPWLSQRQREDPCFIRVVIMGGCYDTASVRSGEQRLSVRAA